MKESHVQDQLSAYLDKALASSENKKIEAHLASCSDCEKVFQELKSMVTWMKAVPQPQPRVGLETRLTARLQDKEPRSWSWMGGLATAMVALIALVIVRKSDLEHSQVAAPQEISHRSEVDKLAETPALNREKANALKPAMAPAPVTLLDRENSGQDVGLYKTQEEESLRSSVPAEKKIRRVRIRDERWTTENERPLRPPAGSPV
jgi:hypothetical protein